jgi:hypothetical protein
VKRQLKDKDAKIDTLELQLVKLRQGSEEEKAARKAEANLRIKAESRLSKYLDAQKEMTEIYRDMGV